MPVCDYIRLIARSNSHQQQGYKYNPVQVIENVCINWYFTLYAVLLMCVESDRWWNTVASSCSIELNIKPSEAVSCSSAHTDVNICLSSDTSRRLVGLRSEWAEHSPLYITWRRAVQTIQPLLQRSQDLWILHHLNRQLTSWKQKHNQRCKTEAVSMVQHCVASYYLTIPNLTCLLPVTAQK